MKTELYNGIIMISITVVVPAPLPIFLEYCRRTILKVSFLLFLPRENRIITEIVIIIVANIHKAIKIRFDRWRRPLCNSFVQQYVPMYTTILIARVVFIRLKNNNNNNNNTGGTELCKSAELGPRVHGHYCIACRGKPVT